MGNLVQRRDGADISLAAAEALERYRLMREDAAGQAVYCDAGEVPLGPTGAYAASGAAVNAALPNKAGTVICIAAAAVTTVNGMAEVFTADDGKVSAVNSGVRFGWALTDATADGDRIEVMPDVALVPYRNTVASSVITDTTDETAFDLSLAIPAQNLRAGDVIRVRAQGIALDQNGTDTCTIKLYAGTEEIVSTGAVTIADNDVFFIDAEIVVRTIGASGTLVAGGIVGFGVEGTATAKPFKKASATEDTTAGLTIALKATFSAAHADNQVRLDVLTIEHLR